MGPVRGGASMAQIERSPVPSAGCKVAADHQWEIAAAQGRSSPSPPSEAQTLRVCKPRNDGHP